MFAKMDKKILITSIIILIVILLGIFLFYKYIGTIGIEVQNTTGGANTEIQTDQQNTDDQNITDSSPQVEVQAEGEINYLDSQGFSVCLDECGDGICLETDPDCGKVKNNLACVCPETSESCPQDCN
ncbi:MAG: hypothetical protein A2402_00375 [Candidatus Staskawiczbacteria bacterium RIFOXYC1_FULL_37_43]|nr:MAG: hypothetical protein A2813_00785 [Candidatus Staskawiczbacteria bacterium RIFCSPHIGHO2_01_FULL_37_17]OGZ72319.1 MAG: hypothetical protein A2891_03555 [Candidatus Staskawiczbacteria bacterium RIFCSPLOWO2_01_FULL_37_19]OGZ76083.1 MAG: hypothetical protein A2205_03445 [Candidatus Staskawiczbacteria bacterium RIFOXYA1_FULL_37_15]OGZ77133.1 MAG: hypothetical protein A2280_03445 [Candidatus Staskawiczbacteria bacterium RIFOXYA12_FULL_37_10]OGZ80050.1 MAG: hypothetical protein A2353_02165 [Can